MGSKRSHGALSLSLLPPASPFSEPIVCSSAHSSFPVKSYKSVTRRALICGKSETALELLLFLQSLIGSLELTLREPHVQPLHSLAGRFRKNTKKCSFRSKLKIQVKSWTLSGRESCIWTVLKPGRVEKKISARLNDAYLGEEQE